MVVDFKNNNVTFLFATPLLFVQPVRNVTTSEGKRRQLCLSDDEVVQLAKWGAAIERHYSEKKGAAWPREMEGAKEGPL